MAFESTRKTRFAIVEEITEGTPVAPSAATDYIALQEGFELIPNFETLENAELQGTIGQSASVQGLESPTASLSHYLRHSGVEGQAPDFNLLLKSAMGEEAINGTERTTTAGSTAGDATTAAVVKLAAGGSDFTRGSATLIKDSVNGYNVRNVTSVATEDLTLTHNLANAPATGVNVGKNIKYTLTDDGIPLSLWDYRGNGGAVQLVSGAKVDSMTLNFPAANAINADFSFVGQSFYYDPIIVGADNDIDFTDSTGAVVGTVAAGTFRDPVELATAVGNAMTAASVGSAADIITVTYSSSTGKFTTESDGTVLTVAWTTAGHIGATIGYTADDSGSLTYVADDAIDYASPYAPTLDGEDFLVAKDNELKIGNFTEYACVAASNVTVNFGKEAVDVLSICETSGKASTLFNGRTITIDVTAYLQKNEVERWRNFRENETVQFAYNAGRKSAGNWIAGSTVNLYAPTTKITNFALGDENGIVTLNMTLTCFVDSAQDEFYLNFL